MKYIFFLLLLTTSLRAQLVCAVMDYRLKHNYSPNEITTITWGKQRANLNVDSINKRTVKQILNNWGYTDSMLIYWDGYGSSTDDVVEIVFMYQGYLNDIIGIRSLGIENGTHRYTREFQDSSLIIPNLQKLAKPELYEAIKQVTPKYPIRSFMERNYNRQDMIFQNFE